jgi:hypothetical protein
MSDPRGIRNNNPGNIRRQDGVTWHMQSAVQDDLSFVKFDKPEYGIRAMVRILRSYQRRGIDTINDVINSWSPPSENDTKAYVSAVCAFCMREPEDKIKLDDIMPELVQAIIWHENGSNPYTPDQIAAGIALA